MASLPPFSSITFNAEESGGENRKPEVAKTGLGSSAAMTTAVVAALLHYLGVVNLSSTDNHIQEEKDTAVLDVVHIIAQTAHCIAQGKVGSGFDVSSAVYGSQRYVRFSPEVLSPAQVCISLLIFHLLRCSRTNFLCPKGVLEIKYEFSLGCEFFFTFDFLFFIFAYNWSKLCFNSWDN